MENSPILAAAKKALRDRGLTYRDVARELGLSESSIKRLFTSGGLSLARLEQICRWAGIEAEDLLAGRHQHPGQIDELSVAQEQTLVDDIELLLLAFLLQNHWTFDDITREYQIDPVQGISLLAQLDRLGIIELQPNNRVRMRLSRAFHWRPNGPIQRFFEQQVQNAFFDADFSGENEWRRVDTGRLSPAALQILKRRAQTLSAEFERLVQQDRQLPYEQGEMVTLVTALRPWSFAVFERLRRQ